MFSQLEALFSIGGKYYSGEPITYNSVEDSIFENVHNITVKLHNRLGKFVKLRLHFAAKWIMISEVTFVSGKLYTFFFPYASYVRAMKVFFVISGLILSRWEWKVWIRNISFKYFFGRFVAFIFFVLFCGSIL